MKKLNLGIVGTGAAAEVHFHALKKINLYNIKSICGKNNKRLSYRKKEWKLNSYLDVYTMVKSENLDVVLICNENNLHFKEAKKAVKAGAHIMVEKPIDADVRNSIKLIELCKKEKKIIAVVMQKRFDKATIYLKKLVKKNILGKIISAKVDVFMYRDKKYFSRRKWIHNSKMIGGGITLHHAVHSIDQIIYILDKKISNVSFWKSNSFRKLSIEDTSGGWIKFDNDLVASVNATVCAYPELKNRIEIYGEKLAVCLEKDKIYKLPFNKNGSINILKSFSINKLGNYTDVWKSYNEALNYNKKIPNLGRFIINTEKTINYMYESSRKGRIINFK